MKRNFYFLVALCISWAFTFQLQAANVNPTAGVFYNIVQTPSNMIFGAVNNTQPVVQTATNSLTQAFEFIPVEGKPDTYYIKTFLGMYLNKSTSNTWSTVYQSTINDLSSEWVITDDASSTTVFRLMLNFNSKYLATDATTTDSYLYCDKAVDHVRGLFTLTPATIPTELVAAYNSLTLGDISGITSNITLPTISGNIPIVWTSSLPLVITNDGVVTQPDKYDAIVKLTASMKQEINGVTYTMTKEFLVTVKAKTVVSEQLAQWNFIGSSIYESNGAFKVKDVSESGFEGTIMNDARIRTIGGPNSGRINVLDLGNGTGYFDMGTDIGKAVYSLGDYTMCGFFRIDDDYAELNNNGNFYWSFSNSEDTPVDMNGYILGSLKAQAVEVTPKYWSTGAQSVGLGTNAPKNGWHHMAFTQSGSTATLYIDAVQVAQNTAFTNIPSVTLPQAGMTGTPFNWLGRSSYPTDVYLRKSLLYDFQLFRIALSAEDFIGYISVADSIAKLDAAFLENPDLILPELTTEKEALDLGNLSAVVSDITLPSKGSVDNTISITWKTKNPSLISSEGKVTRPKYFNGNDTLTATLSKSGQKLTKAFPVTVLLEPGSEFTDNLIVKYDFSTVTNDTIITDAAEKHFTGVVKNDAKIKSIGSTVKYNVLELGDSIGYFDMGLEVGKVLYNLSDYTMSAYYRIDESYTDITKDGNFIWSFSNSTDAMNVRNGYIIGSLKDQSQSITPGYYTAATGNQAISFATPALSGNWHNLTYTQSGLVGTLYVDGTPVQTSDITNIPSTALPKAGFSGTPYNWLGRSCYATDAYLRKTLVYDFRLYKTALTDEQIQFSLLNVGGTISNLELAYTESLSGMKPISNSPYKVIPVTGGLKITGLKGSEKIGVFDVAGREIKVTDVDRITMNAGVYFVKIDNFIAKVIVK